LCMDRSFDARDLVSDGRGNFIRHGFGHFEFRHQSVRAGDFRHFILMLKSGFIKKAKS